MLHAAGLNIFGFHNPSPYLIRATRKPSKKPLPTPINEAASTAAGTQVGSATVTFGGGKRELTTSDSFFRFSSMKVSGTSCCSGWHFD